MLLSMNINDQLSETGFPKIVKEIKKLISYVFEKEGKMEQSSCWINCFVGKQCKPNNQLIQLKAKSCRLLPTNA